MFDYEIDCEVNILGKPSIFSSKYEKKMRKRRRNITILSLIIILAVVLAGAKLIYNPINFSKIKQNLQAWVESDTGNEAAVNNEKETALDNEENKPEPEKSEEPKEASIDIVLSSGTIAKAVYKTENNTTQFIEVTGLDQYVDYDISPLKDKIVICDTNGVMTIYNIDGSSTIISKDNYISSKGTSFLRTDVIANNPQYMWNRYARFITEDKVIFITNRPYFGTDSLAQYLWITDINDGTDKVLWNIHGSSITLSESSEDKVSANIDGTVYVIDADGNYTN